MSENPSKRLVEQRVRNRIMDSLSWLAEGAQAVRRISAQEFFEKFYDWVDDENLHWPWPKASPDTMTPPEVDAVTKVLSLVNAAVSDNDDIGDDAAVIASGWLEQISPVAKAALDLMLVRGCFDEELEENEPSNRALAVTLSDYVS